jgi:nicotinamide mononucleotide adenylyltransferase
MADDGKTAARGGKPRSRRGAASRAVAAPAGGRQVEHAKRGGSAPLYGPEVEDRICELLAEGKHLNQIAAMPGMPAVITMLRWAAHERPAFGEAFTRAREALAVRLVAEAVELVDEPSKDSVHAADKRTRADMRKWLASKLFPRQYGDKVEQTVQALGADGKPVDPAPPAIVITIERAPAPGPTIDVEAADATSDD